MRFHADGPSIPTRLLAAADAGSVVFVCGAGVSYARAQLPTFQTLLDAVVAELRPAPESLISQIRGTEAAIRDATPPITLPSGISGLVSPDRLFGMLEQEFGIDAVNQTVAAQLALTGEIDLSAHRTVLRLASGRDGTPHIVTTNFDLLFEMAAPHADVHLPPRLDPDARGIIKLHGSIDPENGGPMGEGFVLSTPTFGSAYVAEGWAARYLRTLLEQRTVVFLGYTADDPPMQYLLEGLRRSGARTTNVYAFQPGDDSGRWAERGVTAIPYSPENEHLALWNSLESWADRVADPTGWRASVVDLARRGPRSMAPYERGQIADLLRSTTGAEAFAVGDTPPPAEWICVLDPRVRYGPPGQEAPFRYDPEVRQIDPFALYGLDDDEIAETDTAQTPPARTIPPDAWDGLAWTDEDHVELRGEERSNRGPLARHGVGASSRDLPPRLAALEVWLASVAEEPASLWWWARRTPPRGRFRWMLNQARRRCDNPTDAWAAWDRLLECADDTNQDYVRDNPSMLVHHFRTRLDSSGWNNAMLRLFEELSRPRLHLSSSHSSFPPSRDAGVSRLAMVNTEMDYRADFWRMEIPTEWVQPVARVLGRNVARFVELRASEPKWIFDRVPPVARPEDPAVSEYQYRDGIGGVFFGYCEMLERLREIDRAAFEHETQTWPLDPAIYHRLRLWLALAPERSGGETASNILINLPNDVFWFGSARRDTLFAIRDRWGDFDAERRAEIIRRLETGPQENDLTWVEPERRPWTRAWMRLDAVGWLIREGVDLGLDWDRRRVEWMADAPDWNEADVDAAVEAHVSRGGTVRTDTDHTSLMDLPVEEIVAFAIEGTGRTRDYLVEADPFIGLSRDDPERARDAIRFSTTDSTARGKALYKLLSVAADATEEQDVDETLALLHDCPDEVIAEAGWSVGFWVMRTSEDREAVQKLDAFLDRYVGILPIVEWPDEPEEENPDYLFRALNAPAGHVAEAMMRDPRLPSAENRVGLPEGWRARAEALLALPRPHSEHALTIFAGQTPYLHAHAEDWTQDNLLAALEDPSRAAFLAGLRSYRTELPQPIFEHVASTLATFATDSLGVDRSQLEWVSAQLLFAWLRDDGSFSDDAFAEVLRRSGEEFRREVLRYTRSILEGSHDEALRDRIERLIEVVWPRQAALRTESIAIGLVDLALAGGDRTSRLREIVAPFLVPLRDWPEVYRFHDLEGAARSHPHDVLALLDRISPRVANRPVYGLEDIVTAIAESAPELGGDTRLEKLRRASGVRE